MITAIGTFVCGFIAGGGAAALYYRRRKPKLRLIAPGRYGFKGRDK